MAFLRTASAGVLAAALLGALLVATGLGWEITDHMRRERFFTLGLDAIACGWLAAILVFVAGRHSPKVAASRVSAGFWCAAALAFAWWWFPFTPLPAAILLILALRGSMPVLPERIWSAGALLHLAPAAAFFLIPPEMHLLPLLKPTPDLPPATTAGAPVSAERPDVLLIVADTLRADAILDADTPTPHLDALRARGTWAEFALTPCNQTLPSHMVLFTGMDIEQLGMRSNESRWPKAAKLRSEWRMQTVAERLHAAGWRTAGVACNVLLTKGPMDPGESAASEHEQDYDDGFEIWQGMERAESYRGFFDWARAHTLIGHVIPRRLMAFPLKNLLNSPTHRLQRTHWQEGERTMDQALQALDQLHGQDQPGFLFLNMFDPHAPYAAPPPFQHSISNPDARPAGYAEQPVGEFYMRLAMYDAFARERDGGPHEDTDAEAEFLRQLYREEVAYMDAQLGRLMEAVERKGRPTLIVFVGDHGEAFGEHLNVEHRRTLHEEEIRVPFIMAGPGIPEGRQLKQVPELVDATRTLLEQLGLEDASVSGRNVLSTDDVLPRYPFNMMVHHLAIRDARWKLIARISYGAEEDPKAVLVPGVYELKALQLYDMQADQAERNNLLSRDLSGDSAAALERLLQAARARLVNDQFPFMPYRKINAKTAEILAQLGYADSH
jgi:arylsulfatase A-like enzyme